MNRTNTSMQKMMFPIVIISIVAATQTAIGRQVKAADIPPEARTGCTATKPKSSGEYQYSHNQAFLHTALCDFGTPPLTNQELEFVATHFNTIVVGTEINITAVKAINPDIEVYAYFNIMFTAVAEQAQYTEAMFMHDPDTGLRLWTNIPNDGDYFFMDPSSAVWRQYAVNYLQNEIGRGFDGAHLDDVWGDWMHPSRPHPVGYTEIPAWYDAASFRNAVRGMLEYIETQLNPVTVIFNGYGPISLDPKVPFEEVAYVPVTDGVGLEGFVFDDRWGGGYVTQDQWPIIMDAFLALPQDKIVGVISYGSQDNSTARLFSLGSFLLGSGSNSLYAYSPQCDVLTYLPEYRIRLGAPRETFSTIAQAYDAKNQIYKRRFANGLVLVNPTAAFTSSIELPSTMQQVVVTGGNIPELGGNGKIRLKQVRQIKLAPGEAAVLLHRGLQLEQP